MNHDDHSNFLKVPVGQGASHKGLVDPDKAPYRPLGHGKHPSFCCPDTKTRLEPPCSLIEIM